MKWVFCSDKAIEKAELLILSQKLWKIKISSILTGDETFPCTDFNFYFLIYL